MRASSRFFFWFGIGKRFSHVPPVLRVRENEKEKKNMMKNPKSWISPFPRLDFYPRLLIWWGCLIYCKTVCCTQTWICKACTAIDIFNVTSSTSKTNKKNYTNRKPKRVYVTVTVQRFFWFFCSFILVITNGRANVNKKHQFKKTNILLA